MALRIENNVINTSYYKQNKKEVVSETSFEDQLNNSKKKLSVNATDTANLGLVNNTAGYRVSNNYSNEKIEKRRDEIHAIQNEYERCLKKYGIDGDANGWTTRVNPRVMENVLNLNIENNKDIYLTNGKVNINKVAENCGISLNNATPLELESIKNEIYAEGLISEKEADALELFVSRTSSDLALENGCSDEYAYYNLRFNVSDKANYFKKIDLTYNSDQSIRNFDDIVLNLMKN